MQTGFMQIAKREHEDKLRGNVATVYYMWQSARDTIGKKLKDKGIPEMTFGSVVSGAIHDVDNADSSRCAQR